MRENSRAIYLSPKNLHCSNSVLQMIQNALRRAHEAWRKGKIDKTGVMIHKVIAEVDMGTPILVREIPFLSNEDDDLEAFEQRVHRIEWDVVVEGTGIALGNVLRNRS